MILTVTLNPLLERRLFFHSVELGKELRASNEVFSAGGKGINVSRQLNLLGMKNSAFTFLGGNNGKILRNILTEEKIDFTVQSSKSETRSADLIIEENPFRVTTFFGVNSIITKEEAEEFKHKLDKMIQNCSVVIFSGSSPCKATDDIFPYGIELANKYDKISILDTYGNHLKKCIDATPTVIHNNLHELKNSLEENFSIENGIRNYMYSLNSKGIRLIFLTDGANPFYASKFDFHYKIYPPKVYTIDATGSGDAFVAGLAYGLEKSLVFEDFLKRATALGALNAANLETCKVKPEESEKLMDLVSIEPIGKKMKVIDDSPNYL